MASLDCDCLSFLSFCSILLLRIVEPIQSRSHVFNSWCWEAAAANSDCGDHNEIMASTSPWVQYEQNAQLRTDNDVPDDKHALQRIASRVDYADAEERYQIEAEDNATLHQASHNPSLSSIDASKQVISWESGDPQNPYNWSRVCTTPFIPHSIPASEMALTLSSDGNSILCL